jgi:hypothetical protein
MGRDAVAEEIEDDEMTSTFPKNKVRELELDVGERDATEPL